MSDEELQTMLNLAEGEVERLRSLGWTRQDFARALREELLLEDEPVPDAPKWDGKTPTCPHCWGAFKTWSLAKLHVKRCVLGKNPRGRL